MQRADGDTKTILIATDGSPAAFAAVTAGLELAVALQARVRFVHAESPLAEQLYADYAMNGPPPEEILARDSVLAAAFARAEEAGVEAEVEVLASERSADLAAAVAGIADGLDAAMIVVGSRGLGTVAGAVLGSVSHNLLRYAKAPVLVVHAPETGEEASGHEPARLDRGRTPTAG